MPLHVQPNLRAREEVTEAAGMTQDVDSRGVDLKEIREANSTLPKIVPKITFWFLGSTYTPNSTADPTVA